MGKGLTVGQIDDYRRDGFVFPLRAFPTEEAEAFRAAYDAMKPADGSTTDRHRVFGFVTRLSRVIRHAPILDAVEDIVGPDVLCGDFNFFDKAPDGRTFVSWHQDGRYWSVGEEAVVTVWLALTPSNVTAGCMRMLPGSHLTGLRPHAEHRSTDNMLSRGQIIELVVDEARAVDVVLEAGEFSLHHANVAHSSLPNRSGDARIGLAIRYLSPQATSSSREPWARAVPVRGAAGRPPPQSMGRWIAERLNMVSPLH